MRAGTLRNRLEIQAPAGTRTASGDVSTSWSPVTTVYARIEPLSGREAEYGKSIDPRVSHRITIRWRDGLTTDHRFVERRTTMVPRDRAFNILSILDTDERHRELVVMAEEVQPRAGE